MDYKEIERKCKSHDLEYLINEFYKSDSECLNIKYNGTRILHIRKDYITKYLAITLISLHLLHLNVIDCYFSLYNTEVILLE